MLSRLPLLVFIILLLAAIASTDAGATAAAMPERDLLIAPPDDSISAPTSIDPSRLRLMVGGALVIQKNVSDLQPFPFANINYRWSPSFTPGRRPVVIGPTAEIGINLIFPYAKGGLEIRSEHLFFDAHGGLTTGYLIGGHSASFALIPFVGAEGGYLFDVGGVQLELETGINTGMVTPFIAFPYLTVGVAF